MENPNVPVDLTCIEDPKILNCLKRCMYVIDKKLNKNTQTKNFQYDTTKALAVAGVGMFAYYLLRANNVEVENPALTQEPFFTS